MKINEVAKLTGVTVRTLHYYDEIGLLNPYEITESGYRLYNKESLETLQQILFFRELDFRLSEIKKIITNPNYDKKQALSKHKELLVKKRERLDKIINLVNHTIEGEFDMSFEEFDTSEIEKAKAKYAKEVKEKWGDTNEYQQSKIKTDSYTKEDWAGMMKKSDEIIKKFSQMRHEVPDSKDVQELVEEWRNFITEYYYDCTKEILDGLAQMYVCDERFTKNMDKFGEGTATFMSEAIKIYCS